MTFMAKKKKKQSLHTFHYDLLFFRCRIPLCSLVNQHLEYLAAKFPETKFLKSISSLCIPNYPDKNLPTIFVYHDGDMKKQWVGPLAFGGMNLKQDGESILYVIRVM